MPAPHHNSQAYADQQWDLAMANLNHMSDRSDADYIREMALQKKEREATEQSEAPLPIEETK